MNPKLFWIILKIWAWKVSEESILGRARMVRDMTTIFSSEIVLNMWRTNWQSNTTEEIIFIDKWRFFFGKNGMLWHDWQMILDILFLLLKSLHHN